MVPLGSRNLQLIYP